MVQKAPWRFMRTEIRMIRFYTGPFQIHLNIVVPKKEKL